MPFWPVPYAQADNCPVSRCARRLRHRVATTCQPRSCCAPPEVQNSSRRIFALYCVLGGSKGHFNPRFQVLALLWILPLFTPKNIFFEKSRTTNASIRRARCTRGILGVFWCDLGVDIRQGDAAKTTFHQNKSVKIGGETENSPKT